MVDVDRWLARACADADARGLPDLKPLLEALARSTRTLRAATRLVDPSLVIDEAPLTDEDQKAQ